jgi:hypothetical protein
MTDSRIYEVQIVLAHEDHRRPLTPDERRAVIDAFDSVRREATKWRLMTQRTGGRLLIFDPRLVSEIEAFLVRAGSDGQT